MSIPVVCPGCSTRLNAPAETAGKRVTCPKCQTVFAVPVPVALPAQPAPLPVPPPEPDTGSPFDFSDPTPPAPQRRRRSADEEDDADAPPRRGARSRRGQQSGPPLGVILAGVALFVAVCVGGSIGVYYAVRKSPDDTAKGGDTKAGDKGGKPADPPARKAPTGWKEFKAPDGTFRAYFPEKPVDLPIDDQPEMMGKAPGKLYTAATADESLVAIVMVIQFPPEVPPAEREKAMAAVAKTFTAPPVGDASKLISQKKMTWLGQQGTETVTEITNDMGKQTFVSRQALVGNTVYFGILVTVKGRAKPEIENGFFDNITPGK